VLFLLPPATCLLVPAFWLLNSGFWLLDSVKVYSVVSDGEKRYSPAVCIACEKHEIVGYPDPEHVSISYIERANLTMRMGMRRFTRLTNAFSKKIENPAAAVALHMMHYNFVSHPPDTRVTPAIAAGVTNRFVGVSDLLAMFEAGERELERAA
jgi:IS1 family transposase